VGAGNLGAALTSYLGFRDRGFRIVAVFDNDASKVGTTLGEHIVQHVDELPHANQKLAAIVGVVAVPRVAAQGVVDKLVAAGVHAILNFAPTKVLVRPGIAVRDVDLTSEMEILSYYLRAR
jgi:redox-sensing transcriptional repressor